MRIFTLLMLLFGHSEPGTEPDAAQLAVAIVDAARSEAGVTGAILSTPLSTGPLVIDSVTFAHQFAMAFDSSASVAVVDTLVSIGYSFGDREALKRSSTEANGSITDWLDGDAMVVNLISLTKNWETAVARVTIFYTYQKIICPRSVELSFTASGNNWSLTDRKVIGDC
jgi:hypothetical protein